MEVGCGAVTSAEVVMKSAHNEPQHGSGTGYFGGGAGIPRRAVFGLAHHAWRRASTEPLQGLGGACCLPRGACCLPHHGATQHRGEGAHSATSTASNRYNRLTRPLAVVQSLAHLHATQLYIPTRTALYTYSVQGQGRTFFTASCAHHHATP